MNIKEFEKRKKKLEDLSAKIQQEILKEPEGNLRIAKNGNSVQFFLVEEKGDTKGKYLKKNDMEYIKGLAKRNYYEKLLREIGKEIEAITSYLSRLPSVSPEEVYNSLSEYRQELVSPLLLSDSDYAKRWEAVPYEKNPYKPEECIHPTDKGDMVRSKSEARIADMYFALGIPYRYEAPLKLKNGKVKYPDFTILKLPERTLYYHEHLGVMEDETYRCANILKINEYSESQICTGKNLILTFETGYAPLDLRNLRSNIKEIFLPK